MEEGFVKLYSRDELPRLKRKVRALIAAAAAVSAAAVLAVALLAVSAGRTLSIAAMPWAIAVSILGGFIVITLLHFPISDTRAEIKHIEAILAETENGGASTVAGQFRLTGEMLLVRKGVVQLFVSTSEDDKPGSLRLLRSRKALFPAERAVRVKTVYGYITEYETEAGE